MSGVLKRALGIACDARSRGKIQAQAALLAPPAALPPPPILEMRKRSSGSQRSVSFRRSRFLSGGLFAVMRPKTLRRRAALCVIAQIHVFNGRPESEILETLDDAMALAVEDRTRCRAEGLLLSVFTASDYCGCLEGNAGARLVWKYGSQGTQGAQGTSTER
eukprot:Skav225180  [mRNA]  locus=scaffold1095:493283:500928:- [translate_table: standard]